VTAWLGRLALVVAASAWASAHAQDVPTEEVVNTLPTIPYEVELRGPADTDLAARLETELDLLTKKERGVPSLAVLDARMQRDLARITSALHAYGYYDGTVQGTINEGETPRVIIVINQGHLFTIGRYDMVWQGRRPTCRSTWSPSACRPRDATSSRQAIA
jgi:hypothetical protein